MVCRLENLAIYCESSTFCGISLLTFSESFAKLRLHKKSFLESRHLNSQTQGVTLEKFSELGEGKGAINCVHLITDE